MPTLSNHYHVQRAVAAHEFTNSADWAEGIAELADLTDDEIDAIAVAECRTGGGWGYSERQRRADRRLFRRYRGLLAPVMRTAASLALVALLATPAAVSADTSALSGPVTLVDSSLAGVGGHLVAFDIAGTSHVLTDGEPVRCAESAKPGVWRCVAGKSQLGTARVYGLLR